MASGWCGEVQKALQAVARRTRWTYALLWQLCPHQGALVWAEGHYNGAIKTRKTVQPAAGPAPAAAEEEEEAASDRSRQLRELFDSLAREGTAAAGARGGGFMSTSRDNVVVPVQEAAAARRPSAALAPEDLTETEWFYLMSASYSFPPAVGLPGRAFTSGGHVWLSRANEVDSKTFSRAILAKSAGIQTVVCIPIVDGVLEIGTTEEVEEDIVLVQYAMRIFMDHQDIHMMPTISEHSTSNQINHIDRHSFQTKRKIHTGQATVEPDKFNPEYLNNEMEDDDDEIDAECAYDSETNNGRNYCQRAPLNIGNNDQATPNAGSSEPMQLEESERVRDGCSSHLGDEIQMLMACQNSNAQSDLQGQDVSYQSWHFLYEELSSGYPQSSGEDQAIISPENAHYSKAVLSILHCNARRQADPNIKSYLAVSHQSPFSRWHPAIQGDMITEGTPQRMLKSVLFNVVSSPCKHRIAEPTDPTGGDGEGAGGGGAQREIDFSANHVMQERRRREKLNERFIILRSLVPFVTKMDKASILGDTIEYVKQLRRRIHDLESSSATRHVGALSPQRAAAAASATSSERRRRVMAVEASSSSGAPVAGVQHCSSTDVVQVSIIESDALLELRCAYRRGLLVQIMQALQERLQLEITAVQASSDDGVLVAELRAKVGEVHGRRSSISEVKRSIHLIISSGRMLNRQTNTY